ncbi:MAG: cysteine desulfurase, partial [Mycobacterium sp.]
MSTSEYRSVDAESDLPLGAAELAALASQLYAASIRPGPDSPPQSAPVAPRGSVPDTTAATSAGQTAAGSADLYSAPVPLLGITDIYVPAPTPYLPPADFSAFEVPSAGIVPTVPGVLAGAPPSAPVAPRGSAPYSGIGWLPDAPSVVDLNWSDAVPAAPEALNAPSGDEYSYHFLTAADPVPQLPDDHEVFDVNAIREDFPILKETVNGKPLIWFDNAATTQKP